MSVLVFRLNGVSEEEAQDVRELLQEHGLVFYETSAGRWGLSIAGIWLKDKHLKGQARALIDEYQLQRSLRLKSEGDRGLSWKDVLSGAPLQFLAVMVVIVSIVFFSIAPFITFGN